MCTMHVVCRPDDDVQVRTAISSYSNGGTNPTDFMGFRQLCVLLIGGDQDIRAFCDCNGSRFRFNFN